MYISDTTAKKMLKDAGAIRISSDARKEFRKCVDQMAFSVAQKSVKLAHHAKRKTIDVSDVKMACD